MSSAQNIPTIRRFMVPQAVRLASTDARDLVPRLLQLLMVEPKGAETLGRAVAQKAADLPGWIWLPWVPQLMTSLQRPEVAVARRILSAAAGAFPQQLYWHVRPGMLAMKDAAVKAVQDAKAQVRPCNLHNSHTRLALCVCKRLQLWCAVQASARSAAAAAATQPEGTPEEQGADAGAAGEQQEKDRPPSPQIEKPIEVRCRRHAYVATNWRSCRPQPGGQLLCRSWLTRLVEM